MTERTVVGTTRVTQEADDLLQDYEQALSHLAAVDPLDRYAVANAYARLTQRRRELYAFIEQLEAVAGVGRTVTRRF